MFVKGHCSPRKDHLQGSCLSKKTLLSIAKVLNNELNTTIKLKKTTKKKLFNEIKQILSKTDCDTELCWTSLDLIMDNLSEKEKKEMKESFRPLKPESWDKNPNTWLNTTDINNVMEQYEIKYPHFKYYGATPIDICNKTFLDEKVLGKLCDIQLDKVSDGFLIVHC